VMRHISRHTHYMPKHWRGAENTETVRSEFEALFQVFYLSPCIRVM
jgi:autophagy-related protein 9